MDCVIALRSQSHNSAFWRDEEAILPQCTSSGLKDLTAAGVETEHVENKKPAPGVRGRVSSLLAFGVFRKHVVPGEFRSNLSDWFGTVRARAGVAFDRVLIYATGGLAYSDNSTGWVAGGGVEWALPVNWFGSSAVTFGLEGLWLSFEEDDDNNFGGFVGTFTPDGGPTVDLIAPIARDNENDFFVARAKLNFKFGTY